MKISIDQRVKDIIRDSGAMYLGIWVERHVFATRGCCSLSPDQFVFKAEPVMNDIEKWKIGCRFNEYDIDGIKVIVMRKIKLKEDEIRVTKKKFSKKKLIVKGIDTMHYEEQKYKTGIFRV